ncbi:hypothetical protein Tco_0916979 [Tanacetum coccineum]
MRMRAVRDVFLRGLVRAGWIVGYFGIDLIELMCFLSNCIWEVFSDQSCRGKKWRREQEVCGFCRALLAGVIEGGEVCEHGRTCGGRHCRYAGTVLVGRAS